MKYPSKLEDWKRFENINSKTFYTLKIQKSFPLIFQAITQPERETNNTSNDFK